MLNLKQKLAAAAGPAAAAARPPKAAARPEKAAGRPAAGRSPGGQNPGFSKNARGASGGLRWLPLSPPVPLEGPLGPQRAQKCPLGGMGPLGAPMGPRCAAGVARSALYTCWTFPARWESDLFPTFSPYAAAVPSRN